MSREGTKIILVTRTTRLAELVRRFNTVEQARFYIEGLGEDFADYESEDAVYRAEVARAEEILSQLGRLQVLERSFLPNFVFGPEDIVVVIGQDGLVANTIKYLDGQTVIGVNPDRSRWDGKLVRRRTKDLPRTVEAAIGHCCIVHPLTLAEARLNDGQTLLAVNDFFIGPQSHTSAVYTIQVDGQTERQSSSGVVVSTGLGSSGWYASLIAGAQGVVRSRHGGRTKTGSSESVGFHWDADFLRFTVREPFPTRTTGASLVHGDVTADSPLRLRSHMAEHGVIFSDGIESDFVRFNSGTEVEVTIAEKKGYLAI